MNGSFIRVSVLLVMTIVNASAQGEEIAFPGTKWQVKSPAQLGLDPALLAEIAELLGGRGCVVRNGYIVQSWGDLEERVDWKSSAKPVIMSNSDIGIRHKGLWPKHRLGASICCQDSEEFVFINARACD